MRVHGDKIIIRRKDVELKNDYHKYYDELKMDFHSMCGYCGNNSDVVARKFTIDHFVPKKIDPERINDYSNLVYACGKCNRNKWDHWPTNNKTIPHDNEKGFVDPATVEFDNHLARNEEGEIIPLTKVGEYMYNILKFNIRPIKSLWKLRELKMRLERLNTFIEKNKENKDKLVEFWEVSNAFDKLLRYLLDEGEIR